MPREVIDAGLDSFLGETVTGQAADANVLGTGMRAINLPQGFNALLIEPTTSAARVAFTPAIRAAYHFDVSNPVGSRYVDLLRDTKAIIDSDQTGVATITAMATGDFLYIGTTDRNAGFRIDLDNTILNNNASTLTAESNGRNSWNALTITDGTISGAATMGAAIGNITYTAPAAGLWFPQSLSKLVGGAPDTERLYWVRFITSALLDNVEIEQIAVLHHTFAANTTLATARGRAAFFKVNTEYNFNLRLSEIGGFAFASQAAAATTVLNLSWIRRG